MLNVHVYSVSTRDVASRAPGCWVAPQSRRDLLVDGSTPRHDVGCNVRSNRRYVHSITFIRDQAHISDGGSHKSGNTSDEINEMKSRTTHTMPKTRSDRLVVSKRWWLSQILSVGLPPSKYRVGTIVRKGWQVGRNHFAFLGFDPTPFSHLSLRKQHNIRYLPTPFPRTGPPCAKTGESGNPGLLGGELSSAQLCVKRL